LSARAAQCPSCGAEVLFRAGSSLVTVCANCRSAVARKGVDLTAIGKVAELVPTSSPFQVGMEAIPRKKSLKPFRIVGRLQLSFGQGTWDEWHVAFDDNASGWLAEAQGAFYLLKRMPEPKAPPFEAVQPGQRLELSPYGGFQVAERREATYVSAEGELPFDAPPGTVFRYADLNGDDGSFATMDYGEGATDAVEDKTMALSAQEILAHAAGGLDGFYAGQRVELAELGIPGLEGWKERRVSARAASLNCPNCAGPLELKDPAATVRIACQYCGSLLGSPEDNPNKYEVLEQLAKVPFKPRLPLGASAKLADHPYVLLGAMQKATYIEGVTYTWREYLLKETKSEAYHWLVESNGHWSLVQPVTGKIEAFERSAVCEGRSYKHFSTAEATVDAVVGEFYWAVARGEKVEAADYIAPPRILSREKSEHEVAWSEGVYLPKLDVETAFNLKTPLPDPEGVGANQPWPDAEYTKVVKGWWLTMAITAVALFLFFNVFDSKKVVYEAQHPISGPPSESQTVISEPFEVPRTGNLQARLEAPSDNNWVTVSATLINETTGDVRGFALTSDYYHGSDWSEGSKGRTLYIGRVPKGRYVLKLEPEYETDKAPASYSFRLKSGVPHLSRLIWVMVLLALGPLKMVFNRIAFESKRWSESDYSSSSSGSDDDDDE